jgi:hypothetical protein
VLSSPHAGLPVDCLASGGLQTSDGTVVAVQHSEVAPHVAPSATHSHAQALAEHAGLPVGSPVCEPGGTQVSAGTVEAVQHSEVASQAEPSVTHLREEGRRRRGA